MGTTTRPPGYAPTELGAAVDETEAVTAWSLDDDEDWPQRRPTWIVALAVGASVVVVIAAAAIATWHLRAASDAPASSPPDTASPQPEPAAGLPPPSAAAPQILPGVDGEFIAEMRSFGVPVGEQDPEFTVELARAVCATAREGQPNEYPPGTHTFTELSKGVIEINPKWSLQQATRFTRVALNYYYPEIWGPSQEAIAAMPPGARFLATLQDRLGITPVDDSLTRAARQMCVWKAQGWHTDRIVAATNSNNPPEDERIIVEAAVQVYCPEFDGSP